MKDSASYQVPTQCQELSGNKLSCPARTQHNCEAQNILELSLQAACVQIFANMGQTEPSQARSAVVGSCLPPRINLPVVRTHLFRHPPANLGTQHDQVGLGALGSRELELKGSGPWLWGANLWSGEKTQMDRDPAKKSVPSMLGSEQEHPSPVPFFSADPTGHAILCVDMRDPTKQGH